MGTGRTRFRFRGFRCPFGCRFLGKTPGGVTRHKYSCLKNPANTYNPPPSVPPPRSPSPSRTFSPARRGSPSHTLPHESPRRTSPPWSPNNTPPSHGPSHASPRTPFFPHQDFQPLTFPALPPHTPAPRNINNAPIYESPHRIRWIQKGGVDIRIHPYLDGGSFV